MNIILTERQNGTIVNGLRVAAERFDEHVKSLIEMYEHNQRLEPGYRRLVEQFQEQARESRELATQVENADSVQMEVQS